jgi:PTS system mannose-specific IIC component
LELDFEIFGETYQYVTIVIMFLVGYIIRFLSFKSLYKYIVLLVGLTVGWFIV